MKKWIILLVAMFYFIQNNFAQNKIDYGNNPAAGKYYNICGIKMYCEIYGSGKPLLMIHGNGGLRKAIEKNNPYFSKNYEVIIPDSYGHGQSEDDCDAF